MFIKIFTTILCFFFLISLFCLTIINKLFPTITWSDIVHSLNHNQFFSFRSFVPPVRDEESETQRKAHAKRVRETRRSTQGVTLEEIKSAEQFAKYSKKKNQQNSQDEGSDETVRVDMFMELSLIYYLTPAYFISS